ncbi:uncharacterized protein I303_108409 [Kwoniella dejecticola CBS 10117]|uniref:PDZ GRASP-type domain-containing protein n=1 Tax=Kwoniella dejecticola CBS 10117 TaxID=1296121 RepID=A0A1A5ZXH2_9TREE|nr:uncharacterized protein I303_07264 [Kwoniella dejecticola CBS 10117]OBR82504.1 hypothetical protein I303_07264 [Kwoniella dejecticola CBS 10117]
MGQSSSIPSGLPPTALHCLRVADSSPTDGLIEPYFDYLIGITTPAPAQGQGKGQDERYQHHDLSSLANVTGIEGGGDESSLNALGRVVEQNEGKVLGLRVYNAKSQRIRDVHLIPSRAWSEAILSASGSGQQISSTNTNTNAPTTSPKPKPSLLGLSLRVCNPANALESVYHVLDVLEGSPAEMAGLVPWGDYVLAWSGGPLHSENDFYNLIEAHVDKPLRLFVYNSDLDNLREVILYPTRQWGGEGLIGCGIGYGLLHRIPRPSTPPSVAASASGQVDGYFNQEINRISDHSRPAEGIAT